MASLKKNPAEGNAPEENKNTSVPEGKDEIYETLVGMLSELLDMPKEQFSPITAPF